MTSPSKCTLQRLILVVAWVSVHLFLCVVSNQSVSADEDKVNKPYRPIAAGRITESSANRLLVALYCACFLMSYALDLSKTSITLGLLALGYNTFGLSSHWLAKNMFNAAAYVCFEYGGTYLAGA